MKPFHILLAFSILASPLAFAGQVRSEDDAIQLAVRAVLKFHLTTLKEECVLMDVTAKPAYFDIVVRERHSPACGGKPETSPRLFGMRIRKHDDQLTRDVYDGVHYTKVDHMPPKDAGPVLKRRNGG